MSRTSSRPKPPAHLSAKAKMLWKRLNEQFEFEPDAVQTLAIALENLDLADKARELLRVEGLVINGKKHAASDSVKLHDGLYLLRNAPARAGCRASGRAEGKEALICHA